MEMVGVWAGTGQQVVLDSGGQCLASFSRVFGKQDVVSAIQCAIAARYAEHAKVRDIGKQGKLLTVLRTCRLLVLLLPHHSMRRAVGKGTCRLTVAVAPTPYDSLQAKASTAVGSHRGRTM